MDTKIREWLIAEYKQVGINSLRVNTVMSALHDSLAEISKKGCYNKRFAISKNLSVLMYKSGTIEVHIGIDGVLSTYKEFACPLMK